MEYPSLIEHAVSPGLTLPTPQINQQPSNTPVQYSSLIEQAVSPGLTLPTPQINQQPSNTPVQYSSLIEQAVSPDLTLPTPQINQQPSTTPVQYSSLIEQAVLPDLTLPTPQINQQPSATPVQYSSLIEQAVSPDLTLPTPQINQQPSTTPVQYSSLIEQAVSPAFNPPSLFDYQESELSDFDILPPSTPIISQTSASQLDARIDRIEVELNEFKQLMMERLVYLESIVNMSYPLQQTTPRQNILSGNVPAPLGPSFSPIIEPAVLSSSPVTVSGDLYSSTDRLQPPEVILAKYQNLHKEDKLGTLAVKLARESFFGENIMAESTVYGARGKKQFPSEKVVQLKHLLFQLCPQYKYHPHQFEPIWNKCCDAINHACSKVRNKRPTVSGFT